MKYDRLQDAFTPVPDTVHMRVETTLEEIETMKHIPKAKARLSVALALLIVLLLAGITYASSQLGLLDFLLREDREPSAQLLESVIPLKKTKTVDNVKITLTGAAYDGSALVIGWTIENLAPETLAMVVYEGTTVNGIPLADDTISSWLPNIFQWYGDEPSALLDSGTAAGFTRLWYTPGEIAAAERPEEGKWDIQVDFSIQRAPKDYVVVDSQEVFDYVNGYGGDEASHQYMRDLHQGVLDRIAAYGLEIDESGALDPLPWMEDGYTVIDSNGAQFKSGVYTHTFDRDWAPESHEMDLFDPSYPDTSPVETGHATLSFSMDSVQAQSLVEIIEPDLAYTLEDCIVRIRKVTLSPLSTTVDFTLEPLDDDWSHEAVSAIHRSYGLFRLTDGEGRPLEELGWGFAIPDGSMGGVSTTPLDEAETRWIVEGRVSGMGLYERPEALRIWTTEMFSPVDAFTTRNDPLDEATAAEHRRRLETFSETVVIPLP